MIDFEWRSSDGRQHEEDFMASTKRRRTNTQEIQAIEREVELEEPLTLRPADFRFLDRALRLLTTIQQPGYMRLARQEGYTAEEHKLGLELWKRASGIDRPLDHLFLRTASVVLSGSVEQQLLQELDAFENKWFSRTRAIIRRAVPVERRDAFESAFFADLKQQPLGPKVVGSVTAFLARVEGLEKSEQAEAGAVRNMLRARGLGDAKIANVRKLIDDLGSVEPPVVPGDVQAARRADAEQRSALDDLKAWYRDWGTTFRTVFSHRDLVRLGLITFDRAGVTEEDDGEATETAAAGTDDNDD
jgi:hypothetical protein